MDKAVMHVLKSWKWNTTRLLAAPSFPATLVLRAIVRDLTSSEGLGRLNYSLCNVGEIVILQQLTLEVLMESNNLVRLTADFLQSGASASSYRKRVACEAVEPVSDAQATCAPKFPRST